MTAAHLPQPHLDHLRAIAAADRATYTPDNQPQAAHGYILVWHGKADGWTRDLDHPRHQRPGVYAVAYDGRVYRSTGGDDWHGAESWQPVDDGQEDSQ